MVENGELVVLIAISINAPLSTINTCVTYNKT